MTAQIEPPKNLKNRSGGDVLKKIRQWRDYAPARKGAIIVALLPGGLPLVGGYVLLGLSAGYLRQRGHNLKLILPLIGTGKKSS
jgi:hypothetical protein